ncbi:MAG TPA: hypothetical protein PK080_15815, partial [Hyphomonadaceae bacterium]|nr:hypothetical protein [Hyphomonadaceae bacterium]
EQKLPKLTTRVRFPSPAPVLLASFWRHWREIGRLFFVRSDGLKNRGGGVNQKILRFAVVDPYVMRSGPLDYTIWSAR